MGGGGGMGGLGYSRRAGGVCGEGVVYCKPKETKARNQPTAGR